VAPSFVVVIVEIIHERTDIFQFGKGLSHYLERGLCDKHHTSYVISITQNVRFVCQVDTP